MAGHLHICNSCSIYLLDRYPQSHFSSHKMIPFMTQYTSHDNSFCILDSDENELSANIVPTKNLLRLACLSGVGEEKWALYLRHQRTMCSFKIAFHSCFIARSLIYLWFIHWCPTEQPTKEVLFVRILEMKQKSVKLFFSFFTLEDILSPISWNIL